MSKTAIGSHGVHWHTVEQASRNFGPEDSGNERLTTNQTVRAHGIPSSAAPSAVRKQLLLWLVAAAFFMESLDTTILNTAVPAIARDLNAAPLSLKSLVACYTLSLATLIPISGWVADRFGTRRVFGAVASLTLGLPPTFLFVAAMLVGMIVHNRLLGRIVPANRPKGTL